MSKDPHMPKVATKDIHQGQFNYLGSWVDKEHFRAFVYNEKGEQKLAENYQEFESLTHSGLWYAEEPDLSIPKASPERKQKYDTLRTKR
jgi:hypothetical protein